MILADIWTDGTLNEEVAAFLGENDAEGSAYVSVVGGNRNRHVLSDTEAVLVMARRLKYHSKFVSDMVERSSTLQELVSRHYFQESA